MSTTLDASAIIPWWKEPTKDQWNAYIAAWLGWTLDAFDFTIFLLIMVPIAKEFDVPLTAVTAVFTITLWMRLVGATAAGWMADRMGRKAPLMISILWYSLCNFIAGFSPTFAFLFFFRALLGIGMGAEWPAGAALAMESWPPRSRGFMSGILQGSWGLGFALSALAYGFLFDLIGWRGLLWIGILPAFVVLWIRYYVKEPEVWVANKRIQRETKSEVKAPLFSIFKRGVLSNTLTACLWMGSAFCVYYSIWALFSTYLQKELNWTPRCPIQLLLQVCREQSPDRVVDAEGAAHPQAGRQCVGQHAALEDREQGRLHFGLSLPLDALIRDPNLRFFHVIPDPEHDECRQYSDPQQTAPADQVEQEAVGQRR